MPSSHCRAVSNAGVRGSIIWESRHPGRDLGAKWNATAAQASLSPSGMSSYLDSKVNFGIEYTMGSTHDLRSNTARSVVFRQVSPSWSPTQDLIYP